MGMLVHDFRYALHRLRKSPGFTATVIITLALGIGANTAAFTLMYGVLLRYLPVSHPEQLYRIGDTFKQCCSSSGFLSQDGDFEMFSSDLYVTLQKAAPEFEQLAAVGAADVTYSVKRNQAPAQEMVGYYVSGNYFDALGVVPSLGRGFSTGDDIPGAAPVVVLSYSAWEREFAADSSIVGSKLLIQTYPFTVVGIAPPTFFGDRVAEDTPDFWIPLAIEPLVAGSASLHGHNLHWLYLIGRLRPGTVIHSLQSRLSDVLRQWLIEIPAYAGPQQQATVSKQHVVIVPARQGIGQMGNGYRAGLNTLMLLSATLLLIACANIANLLLVRSVSRRAELSLRVALGAPRSRLIRQVFTESFFLLGIGAVVGIGIAFISSALILALTFPDSKALPIHARPSPAILGFAFTIALITGILFSIPPVRASLRVQPAEVLRGLNHSTQGLSSIPQKILLISQAALSLVLLFGAFLTARSLYHLGHQTLGLDHSNRFILHLDMGGAGYTPESRPALYRSIQSRFGALGGVTGVGLAGYSFLAGWNWFDCVLTPGQSSPISRDACYSSKDAVTPRYLEIQGIRLLRGREFIDADTSTSTRVAVVNESFANRFFPNKDPIGKHFASFQEGKLSQPLEIVGVSRDFKTNRPRSDTRPMYLVPVSQYPKGGAYPVDSILIHFDHVPPEVEPLLRATLTRVDPNLTVTNLQSMDSQIDALMDVERLIARLAIVFGVFSVILAAVGLYGVTSYLVAQRTGEIGIRMALGSTRLDILLLVLRGVIQQTGLGLAVGIPCALLVGYLIRSQLFRVHWYDPNSLIAAVLVLALCALAAGLVPAHRAASVQPMKALRME